MAHLIGISVGATEAAIKRIREKCGGSNRIHTVVIALAEGLIYIEELHP